MLTKIAILTLVVPRISTPTQTISQAFQTWGSSRGIAPRSNETALRVSGRTGGLKALVDTNILWGVLPCVKIHAFGLRESIPQKNNQNHPAIIQRLQSG